MRTTRLLAALLLLAPATSLADDGPPTKRLSWDDSKVVGSPDPPLPYQTFRAFPKLTVKQPLTLTPEPGTRRLFLLEHLNYWAGPGRLIAIQDDQDVSEGRNLLDIDGLAVGVAFHPNYASNGYVFLGLNGGRPKTTQVVRYTVDPRSPDRIDPSTKRLIIEWPSNGHDGGDVAFGNDGFLYVSSGDGSSDSDANLTGQKTADLQGSVLRIDVNHEEPGRNYAIPKDNPFVDRPGARAELWCYGLRNPWRMSFDKPSGQLWVGNNGQDLWEQVYLIRKGANYGWSVSEGSHPFRHQRKTGPDPISPPIAEHSHNEARSLTGGRVYRGQRLPELVGAYLYGDWSTGKVWGVKVDAQGAVLWHRQLVDTPFSITGFGTDHAGEIYIIDEVSGFHRLEPSLDVDKPAKPFPTLLSRTGLFASVNPLKAHPAALPYRVVAPGWNDGAKAERVLAVPGLERIEQKSQRNAGGAWTFPNGSVLAQTLSLNVLDSAGKPASKRVETRLMTREQGEWVGYSYRWNPEQTDAELVGDSGASDEFEIPDPAAPGGRREQVWRFPSRAECLTCHSRAMGFVLGFTPPQLDREINLALDKPLDEPLDTPLDRRLEHSMNQLDGFERLGLFQGKLPARSDDRPRLVNPYDAQTSIESRVRSYLDVNCATCHVKEGGGNALMELNLTTPTRRMNLIDAPPVHASMGLEDARLVAPGAPGRSVLLHRISIRGGNQMPPLMSNEVNREAVKLIEAWIKSLPTKKGTEGI